MKQLEPDIVLSTLNASYIHASLGLRYLYANMGILQPRTRLMEFTIANRPDTIVETLMEALPACRIFGFGVYIWNVMETTEVIRLLKILCPDITIIIGGPEVSFERENQPICKLADFVITGQADVAFAELCEQVLRREPPATKLVSPLPIDLKSLQSPYPGYDADDLSNRVLYVEASRGCPFKCEFCLSSLDRTAEAFDLERFLADMQALIERGARQFKFVDRTFNLKVETSRRILAFFLAHMATTDKLFLHFELIPDRLPDALRDLLTRFPAGSLQFEIGIQSFEPDVQQRISRRQNHERTCANLRWLREHTEAHIHTDLIFGLPGETLDSFGKGFDLLYSLRPQEIQVGMLKRLRGTPIARHTREFDMRYASSPPYRILANRQVDFPTMQRVNRFARYWDLIGNSGRFPNTLPQLLGEQPFARFMIACDWLHETTRQTHRIALPRLFRLLHELMRTVLQVDTEITDSLLLSDYRHNGLRGQPDFIKHRGKDQGSTKTLAGSACGSGEVKPVTPGGPVRQARHQVNLSTK